MIWGNGDYEGGDWRLEEQVDRAISISNLPISLILRILPFARRRWPPSPSGLGAVRHDPIKQFLVVAVHHVGSHDRGLDLCFSMGLVMAEVKPAPMAIARKVPLRRAGDWAAKGDVAGAAAGVDLPVPRGSGARSRKPGDPRSVSADGHDQRVDEHVLARDAVILARSMIFLRNGQAHLRSSGCRSRRWRWRSPPRRTFDERQDRLQPFFLAVTELTSALP